MKMGLGILDKGSRLWERTFKEEDELHSESA